MATAYIQPPQHFEPGKNPAQSWEDWRSAYEIYEEACEYTLKEVGPRRALLLHVLGPAARKTYKSFLFPATTTVTAKLILDKFDELYRPYRNVTHSSAVFNGIVQKKEQTIDDLVSELRAISINCDFGDKEERLIGDRLIVGIRDSALRERLLREPSLTLDRIIALCKAAEISKSHVKTMQSTSSTAADDSDSVNAIGHKKQNGRYRYERNRRFQKYERKSAQQTRPNNSVRDQRATSGRRRCTRCDTNHPPKQCPAYGTHCNACGAFGHFAKVCRNTQLGKTARRQISALDNQIDDSESLESLLISNLSVQELRKSSKWQQTISTNAFKVNFKIDTGSDVNLIPYNVYAQLLDRPELEPANSKIVTYSGHPLPVLGKCTLNCDTNIKSGVYDFCVVNGSLKPILGADTCEQLGLVVRTNLDSVETIAVQPPNEALLDILSQFDDVFTGVGRLPGKQHITIKDGKIPTIAAPRSIPQGIQAKVKLQLQQLVKQGIIVDVTEPTDWVHPLVITTKKNGGVRLCLDPRRLNTVIQRERYKIPTQQELFADLGGCKFFSLLDAREAFWQIQLDEESSYLCTFATPWGRFRFLRLPYGLNCSPELFQRTMDNVFGGLPNIHLYFDDILIATKTREEHSKALTDLLQKARSCGLKLNKSKVKIGLNEVSFLGHTLSATGIAPDPQKVKAIMAFPPPANTIEHVCFGNDYVPNQVHTPFLTEY